MRKLAYIFGVALFLFGCAGMPLTPPPSPAEIIKEYKERVRKNPNDADAYFMLGFTYDRIGEYEKAVSPLKKLIQLKPNSFTPHNNLGYAYEKLGRIDEAIKEYRTALRIEPGRLLHLHSNIYEQVVEGYSLEFKKSCVNQGFIARIFIAPSNDLWVPKINKLIDANAVHEVIKSI